MKKKNYGTPAPKHGFHPPTTPHSVYDGPVRGSHSAKMTHVSVHKRTTRVARKGKFGDGK